MLVIERVNWRQPRYVVRDDRGHTGRLMQRRFAEAMAGEMNGNPRELRRDGRRHLPPRIASPLWDLAYRWPL